MAMTRLSSSQFPLQIWERGECLGLVRCWSNIPWQQETLVGETRNLAIKAVAIALFWVSSVKCAQAPREVLLCHFVLNM